jgi:acylphosphatase
MPDTDPRDKVMCAHAFIEGRVQGVCFRLETRKKAQEYSVRGWVKNLADGRVEAYFIGLRHAVEPLVRWCHEGPPYAHVETIHVKWREATLTDQKIKDFMVL